MRVTVSFGSKLSKPERNSDGDSNEIDKNDLQYEKQLEPRISTELGIKISFNDLHDEIANDVLRLEASRMRLADWSAMSKV